MENELLSQIDRLINMYQWSMGTFITILALVLGFIGILQWRLSTKQIQNIKTDIEEELIKKYEINLISSINNEYEDTNKKVDELILNMLRINNLSESRSYKLQTFQEINSNIIFNSTLSLANYSGTAPDRVLKAILVQLKETPNINEIKNNKDDKELAVIFVSLLSSKSSKEIKETEDYKLVIKSLELDNND